MLSIRAISAGVLALLSSSAWCNAQQMIASCGELMDAFELTATQDVEVMIDPNMEIDCGNFTTMSMDSNRLTVLASEELCPNCAGDVRLREVRFEITNGAKLFWEPSVTFFGTDLQDVDGGAVFVGTDSTARFSTDFATEDVGVRSFVPEGTDFADIQRSAGCVYVDGYFVVEGDSSFVRCEVSGGGESSPGPGGVMLVSNTGSALFEGTVYMAEVSIIDDEGNNGGGIYNAGKVNIKGNALFEDLRAESGGAIFNAEGAEFRFKSGATAVFNDCLSFDGIGGAVNNQGYFKLSGAALVLNSRSPGFVVGSSGYTRLSSEENVFFGFRGNGERFEPFVLVQDGGRLTGFNGATFVDGNPDPEQCATVLFQEDGTCL